MKLMMMRKIIIIVVVVVVVVVVIVIAIVVLIIVISFMQGIYTYLPETNYVPREYIVAAILLLVFMVLISLVSVLNLLYFYISTFRSMCAVPNMAVSCSSLTSWFPGILLTYFLNVFEIVPVALLLLLLLLLLLKFAITKSPQNILLCVHSRTSHYDHNSSSNYFVAA